MADVHDEYQRQLLEKIHSLGDLELAALLCLISREHCLISTLPDSVDELADELRLIAQQTFNLSPVKINFHSHTTLDDFATALLIPPPNPPSPLLGSSTNSNGHNTHNWDTRSPSPLRPRQNDQQSGGSYFFQPTRTAGTIRASGSGNIPLSPSNQTYSSQQQNQPQMANIIIAKHLDRAPKAVQIQALELLRTRRIFTRTSVQPAPKQFLFIALVGAASGGQARVTTHLNDFFYISHWHDPEEDGFPHLDGEYDWGDDQSSDPEIYDNDDGSSIDSGSSVVKKTPAVGSGSFSGFSPSLSSSSRQKQKQPQPPPHLSPDIDSFSENEQPLFTETDISHLAQQTQQVRADVSVVRYQMNIVAFLRIHRAVGGGVSPAATKHLDQLMKSLAPLHGVDYVTPSLVALAAKKIYMHRIAIVAPEKERSMQWGSELAAVESIIEGLGPEEVIEDVLGMVAVPY